MGQQLPRQQHQSTQSVLQGVVGNHVQSSTTSTDPSIMSSLLQGLAGAFNQQHQHQARNAPSDLLSLLSVQQFSHMGSGGQGLDLTRLAASGLLANLQSASNSAPVDQQPGPVQQAQALANLFSSQQGNKSNQTQEQALALARLAGARLLSSDESHRSESARKDSDSGQDRVKQQKEPMINNSSSFVANRQSATTPDVADDSARGRNLEPGAIAVPCRARGMPMDHNPLVRIFIFQSSTFGQLSLTLFPFDRLDGLFCDP